MKCWSCNKDVPAGAKTCPSCAADLSQSDNKGRRETQNEGDGVLPISANAGYVPKPPPVAPKPQPVIQERRTRQESDPDLRAAIPGGMGYVPDARQGAVPPASGDAPPSRKPRAQPVVRGAPPERGMTRLDEAGDGTLLVEKAGHRRVIGWMVSFDFNEVGQDYVLRAGKSMIGRDRDCDISLFFDDLVGRKHAELLYRSGKLTVKDKYTTNGTFVCGTDIGADGTARLNNGDTLRVGRSTFKIFLLDEEEVKELWPRKA